MSCSLRRSGRSASCCSVVRRLKQPAGLQHQAAEWIESFEARFSRFRPESLLSRINREAGSGWVEIDRHTEVLLDLAAHCHFVTEGAFDATSLPLTLLWDWQREHARLPTEEEIARAKSRMGWSRVRRRAWICFVARGNDAGFRRHRKRVCRRLPS